MIFRMILSLLPTAKNRESYKRDHQLAYLIEHEPDLFQGAQASDLSEQDILNLQARIDREVEKPRRKALNNFYSILYPKITRNWDKGLGALTDARRAELLRDCRKTL